MSDLYLAHHGVKGQKHGVRQWQNPDGSLTPAGRIHYGVGAARDKIGGAAKSIGKAIRKKVKPTNAELNAQIRKQKSKNLNKQKRRELRDLKRGMDSDASSSSENKIRGQHKRFSEMSDQDIQARIKRLKSEIELADLERTKSMGPGMRLVDKALRDAGQRALTNIVGDELTKAGKMVLDSVIESSNKPKTSADKKKRYDDELAERKAKQELSDYKKAHPEGIAKLSPSARKNARKIEESSKFKDAVDRAQKTAKGRSELERRAKAYKDKDISIKDIAKRMNLSESQVKDLLYE